MRNNSQILKAAELLKENRKVKKVHLQKKYVTNFLSLHHMAFSRIFLTNSRKKTGLQDIIEALEEIMQQKREELAQLQQKGAEVHARLDRVTRLMPETGKK